VTKRRRRPALTPAILADDSKFHGIIDTLLTQNQSYWRHTRQILRLQLRHQELASEDAFVALLHLEEAWTEREAWMLAAVARWAFGEGRRSGRKV